MAQIIDADPSEVRDLTLRPTVALPIPVEQAVAEWDAYQELTRRLLNETDYQQNGRERFKKKSAWRKYAKAFNLNDRVTYEHIERAPDGWPIWARFRVETSAPNGRTSEADHECHTSERCCPAALGQPCRKKGWSNHSCCSQGCNGRMHWGHPGDVAATALTRAKNRAISDLIGAGEVSAEEIEREQQPAATPAPPSAKKAQAPRQQAKPDVIEGEAREVPADDDAISFDDQHNPTTPPWEDSKSETAAAPQGDTGLRCEDCGEALKETKFKDGTVWTPEQLAAFGRRKHGHAYCMTHYREHNDAAKKAAS